MKNIIYLMIVVIVLIFYSCEDMINNEELSPNIPPQQITVTSIIASETQIIFILSEPIDYDYKHGEITCNGVTEILLPNKTVYKKAGLTSSTLYYFSLVAVDTIGFRSEENTFSISTTSGAVDSFFPVFTAEELNAVRGGVAGYEDWGLDKKYLLMADIDLSGYADGEGWVPIGNNSHRFTGSIQGNGYSINNLTINRRSADFQGLFSCSGAGSIFQNIFLENVYILGGDYTGSLSGQVYNGIISDCHTEGFVRGYQDTGGLVGTSIDSNIFYSFVSGEVYGDAGGLIGRHINGLIKYCYTICEIGGSWVGGIVGVNEGSIYGSYSASNITGYSSTISGGIAGGNNVMGTISHSYSKGTIYNGQFTAGITGINYGLVEYCYSNCYLDLSPTAPLEYVGGSIGYNTGTVISSFYDIEITGQSDIGKGYPKSTIEMKTFTTYTDAGWDFTEETANGTNDDWSINPSLNNGYPYLTNNPPTE